MTKRIIALDGVVLDRGAHDRPEYGMCVMEAVAYFSGEEFSDHPTCVSPRIGAFLRTWNDQLEDEPRQRLQPYIQRVVGTNTEPADEETRAWLATDWLVRVHTPVWLELAGLKNEAAKLRALPALSSSEIATVACQSVIKEACSQAAAAWAAAGDAARAAARAAARDAARAAAWFAAYKAARSALRPTEQQLMDSAFELLDRMITVSKPKQKVA